MNILVVGANGWIGLPLVKALAANGHQVSGLVRNPANASAVQAAGGQAWVGDVFDRPRLVEIIQQAAPQALISQLSDLPGRLRLRQIDEDTAKTNRLREEGTRLLLEAALGAGVPRLIVQSTAAVYAPGGFSPARESDPLYLDAPGGFSQVVQAVEAMEQAVVHTPGISGMALRYGHIYGPGSPYDQGGFVRTDVLERRMPLFGSAAAYFSFVHLEDVIQATVLAVESSLSGIFNIADSHPAQMAEWLPWWAEQIGAPQPLRIPAWLARLIAGSYGVYLMESQSGVDNSLARQALGWSLRYPHWRDGFQAFERSPKGSLGLSED